MSDSNHFPGAEGLEAKYSTLTKENLGEHQAESPWTLPEKGVLDS